MTYTPGFRTIITESSDAQNQVSPHQKAGSCKIRCFPTRKREAVKSWVGFPHPLLIGERSLWARLASTVFRTDISFFSGLIPDYRTCLTIKKDSVPIPANIWVLCSCRMDFITIFRFLLLKIPITLLDRTAQERYEKASYRLSV